MIAKSLLYQYQVPTSQKSKAFIMDTSSTTSSTGSIKVNGNRKSDAGMKKGVKIDSSKVMNNKRRQTIADIAMKENLRDISSVPVSEIGTTGSTTGSNMEPAKRPSSDSSPFKNHHTPVALGAAASYYFKGVPQTPVQKMIRSEQQKLLLQASMQDEDDDNTGSILVNQSYLSSSSSSGGRNSSRDETEALNTSVLSDTTELTASNFLVLAATHRTTAEDIRKIAEERRQPLTTLLHDTDEFVATSSHAVSESKRRQSVAEGVDIPLKETLPRRRETMATVPIPRAASSPVELPAFVLKSQHSQQRERNKVADFQRRLSDSSFNSNVVISTRRRSSIAPSRATDTTSEFSILSSDMKTLLNPSVHKYDRTENEISVPVDSNNTTSRIDKIESLDHVDKVEHPSKFIEYQDQNKSMTSKLASSPSKKENINSKNKDVQGSIDIINDTPPGSALSPARITRSASKKAAESSTLDSEVTALFQSPVKNSRRCSSIKSPLQKQINPVDGTLFHLSPAKSTRSASKKRLVDSSINSVNSRSVLSQTDDTTESIGRLLLGMKQKDDFNKDTVSDNTTASLGDLLDDVVQADDIRLDTSVTPTARNTRSAQKERTESITMVIDSIASSPARNTRSAQRTKVVASPSPYDTAQLLLDITAEKNKQAKVVIAKSSIKQPTPPTFDVPVEEDDVLNNLVARYSTNEILFDPSKTPTQNVDTSQESTISLNDLLIDYLPQSQIQKSVSRLSVDGVCPADKESVSSLFVQSAVSKASTIDTPHCMVNHDQHIRFDVTAVPHSPPSTIRFCAVEDSYVEKSLIAPTMYFGQSPLRKALTPSRLAPSPRRFIHSINQMKSPLKPALTPSRLPAAPYRLASPMVVNENPNRNRSPATPTLLQQSHLRPKRRIDVTDDQESSSALKRQKAFQELQGLARDSLAPKESAPTSISSKTQLQSALRQPGHGSVRSGMKRVEFRSPTYAQFNKTSPAENVTPMITRRSSFAVAMHDDTAEIEVDMRSLMESCATNTDGAGRTPGAKQTLKRTDGFDDSNMSCDSTTLPSATAEPTVTLESDMISLLKDAPQLGKLKNECDEENTFELETDINTLLNIPTIDDDDFKFVGRRSLVFDDEPTLALESDINALFADDVYVTSAKQPAIESRRFSVIPTRRLSLSMDGSFDHAKSEDSTIVQKSIEAILLPKDVVFDLKVEEIVDYPLLQSLFAKIENDFLFGVERVMRENGMSDTMEAFTNEVLKMIESQTDPYFDPGSVLDLNEDSVDRYNALQYYFRNIDKESKRGEMHTLLSSLCELDKFAWLSWLVSAAEQLSGPVDDKSDQLSSEIEHLDRLCFDTEQCLASVTNKSVQRARKKGIDQRVAEIASLESEIASIEADIRRFQGYLAETSKEADIFSAITGAIKENNELSLNLTEGEKLATMYEQKCNTLKGAVKLKPLVLNHTEFSFTYHGSSPNTCVALSFHILSPTSVSIAATVDPTLFENLETRDAKILSTVSSILQIRMKLFCELSRRLVLRDVRDIPLCLRRMDYLVGRLESAAMELAKLKERYRGKVSLSHIANSSSFQLKIRFSSQSGMPQLEASFEIAEAYPFSPLNVCLDTFDAKINVEALQKLMVKNAKPGFGYLSRICDVLESSLH